MDCCHSEIFLKYAKRRFCDKIKYVQDSLEKYIKLVTEIKPRCVNTNNKRNDSIYKVSCKCGYQYCSSVVDDILLGDKKNVLFDYLSLKFDDNGNIISGELLDYDELLNRANLMACANSVEKSKK